MCRWCCGVVKSFVDMPPHTHTRTHTHCPPAINVHTILKCTVPLLNIIIRAFFFSFPLKLLGNLKDSERFIVKVFQVLNEELTLKAVKAGARGDLRISAHSWEAAKVFFFSIIHGKSITLTSSVRSSAHKSWRHIILAWMLDDARRF